MDECDRQMSHCDSNANCVNTIGSHECYCAEGYEGNGLNCTGKNKDRATKPLIFNLFRTMML